MSKILTIGIPTFNRADYLDKCLESLFHQINEFDELIEVHISNNASTDNTDAVIQKYIDLGCNLKVTKQIENLGMDGNFAFLYEQTQTKYMWMFSDDDLILPNVLRRVVSIIKGHEFGVLYLNNYWYETLPDTSNIDFNAPTNLVTYNDPLLFVDRVNYWFTFISGNIVNKDVIKNKIAIREYDKTLLILLSWIIPTAFCGKPNLVLENCALACKGSNSGGYRLYKVFGENLNKVIDQFIRNKLIDKMVKSIINKHLLNSFFPMFVHNTGGKGKFEKETPLKIMIPIYWKYPTFWKKIFPALLKNQFIKKADA